MALKIGIWNIYNMKLNRISTLSLSLLLLTACSTKKINKDIDKELNATTASVDRQTVPKTATISTPQITDTTTAVTTIDYAPQVQTLSQYSNSSSSSETEEYSSLVGPFAGNYKLRNFIEKMHNQHNFDYAYLYRIFSEAEDINQIVEPCITTTTNSHCITPVKPKGKWDRYRSSFIYERNINRGVAFWNEHENTLNKAYQVYGVLPEYIIGIIGVETAYGVNFGKKRVIDVLTSKAMLNDRRKRFYTNQLEKFLILARDSNLDASTLMGSDAGAMGYGQFIASSYRSFAVDFNEDGVTDLWNAEDAIGSIANYFSQNGWKRGIRQIAVRAKYRGSRFKRLKTGYKTKYSQYRLRKKYKITPRSKMYYKGPVSLIKLPKYSYDELWFGTHNFRVITTYNHNTFYGMTVFQLGQEVKKRRYE